MAGPDPQSRGAAAPARERAAIERGTGRGKLPENNPASAPLGSNEPGDAAAFPVAAAPADTDPADGARRHRLAIAIGTAAVVLVLVLLGVAVLTL
jgi:hypothetical protein